MEKKHKVVASCAQGVHPEPFLVGIPSTNGWTSAEEGCSEQEYPKITGCEDSAAQAHPPSK